MTAEGTRPKRLWSEALVRGPSSRIDTNLSLEGLAAGGYRLRVSTADGSTTADREIGFVVR